MNGLFKRNRVFPLISLCLFLLIFLLAFSSCSDGNENPSTDSTTPDTTGVVDTTSAAPNEIFLSRDGISIDVIRPDEGSDAEIAAAKAVAAAIERLSGKRPEIQSDFLMPKKAHDDAKTEIIIGDTNYSQTKSVRDTLLYGEYEIRVVGNKIVVAAIGDRAVTAAANALAASLKYSKETDGVYLPTDFVKHETIAPLLAALPVFESASAEYGGCYDCGDGSDLLLFKSASASEFMDYSAKLTANGYSKTDEYDASGNTFAFFEKAGSQVHLSFVPYTKSLRIITANAVSARAESTGTDAPRVCSTQITLIGLAYDTKNNGTVYGNGLSVLIRLSDGRFIIVDGGGNNDIHLNLVTKALKEQAPDPNKIVIAAWFLTHAHVDHVGVFHKFTADSSLKNSITVQNIICNVPTDDYLNGLVADSEGDNTGKASEVRSDIRQYANTSVIKTHAGETFSFADAKIEMLFTVDMNIPATNLTNSNSASLVFRITFDGGKTLLVTGDASLDVSAALCSMYGTLLKSDIVTVNHHGYGGATALFYQYVNPTTVLWPSSKEVYNMVCDRDYNKVLLSNPNVKDVLIADNGIFTVVITEK